MADSRRIISRLRHRLVELRRWKAAQRRLRQMRAARTRVVLADVRRSGVGR